MPDTSAIGWLARPSRLGGLLQPGVVSLFPSVRSLFPSVRFSELRLASCQPKSTYHFQHLVEKSWALGCQSKLRCQIEFVVQVASATLHALDRVGPL